jgi:hypothetical protein
MLARARATGDRYEIGAAARPVFTALLLKQTPLATNDNAYRLLRLTRDQTAAVRAVSPRDCASFASGKSDARADLGKALTKAEVDQDDKVRAAVLEQTAKSPQPPLQPLSEDRRTAIANGALQRLPAGERAATETMLATGRRPATDLEAQGFCDYQLAYYDQILQAPPGEAGAAFRSLIVSR